MQKSFWRIAGFAGIDQIFERILPQDMLADEEVQLLLQCLLAREMPVDDLIDSLGRIKPRRRAVLQVERIPGTAPAYRTSSAGLSFEASIMAELQPATIVYPCFGSAAA